MNAGLNWDELRSLVAVIREGSLSGAARRLRVAQPTVGRHIDSLEVALGSPLFTRSQRGLTPTPTALTLIPHLEAMNAAAAALERAASGEAAADRGIVRLTASRVMGCEVLPSILAGFQADHPGIEIELALTNRTEDLARQAADIAVRMVRPTQSDLIARRIGHTPIGLYAHRGYLARFGTPATLADLAGHRLIGFDRDDSAFRDAGDFARSLTRQNFGFRCDDDIGQIAALRAGIGIGACQDLIARRSADLVPVLADTIRHSLEIWLVMHEDLKSTRRIRLLFDCLARGLAAFLSGEAGSPGLASHSSYEKSG